MFEAIRRFFSEERAYEYHEDAVVISCFFNPMNSPYRLKSFNMWYDTIKHLNHRIVECVIGDTKQQLPQSKYIIRLNTPSLLWHKEALLNGIIRNLPKEFKYVFWVDADVLFTNPNWLVEGAELLRSHVRLIQPFEYCVHLQKDEVEPSFEIPRTDKPNELNSMVWRSFCRNYVRSTLWQNHDYNVHGHVGFAWGARREVLDIVPLYDKALIGGADHIIAHAATGAVRHECIKKAFTDEAVMKEISDWGYRFYLAVGGQIGYVPGDLYHLWHGDVVKRDYLNRIRKFASRTKTISRRDNNGLYISDIAQDAFYMWNYFQSREVKQEDAFVPGGGSFGGAGASDSWDEEPNKSEPQINAMSATMVGLQQSAAFEPFS